jgi:zinc/manganese transport system permease protein
VSTFELLLAPFCACVVLIGIHCYLGLHVVRRGVIFVDLALAQLAAFGGTVGLLAGYEAGSTGAYVFSLVFALLGAGAFAYTRTRAQGIPQEATIGITYAVSSAYALLILDKAPHGHEQMEQMLVGSILYVTWGDVAKVLFMYSAIALVHLIFRRQFFALSFGNDSTLSPRRILFWDFMFYASFGVVVTSSVQLAGVLLVFSFLIIPAVCAMYFATSVGARLLFGWIFGLVVSVVGLYLSATFDLPTGAAIVGTFGLAWMGSTALAAARAPRGAGAGGAAMTD